MAAQSGANKSAGKRLSNFFRGVKAELKKVSWPNKKELINNTGIVIAMCVLVAAIVGLFDSAIQALLKVIL
ncbi:preprotein translocase subunit SecE [Dethiothermospora halolimnae]|uniref:preprotein translocase subunit SecE n=1 Tax=Dethiothermospora halolimnae TaxID=3114390 RepID=UPI003CCBDA6C